MEPFTLVPQLLEQRRTSQQRSADGQLRVLRRFVEVYCRAHHGTDDAEPCAECLDLVEYARKRLQKCPHDPKPKCKDCATHCYNPQYRQRVREIMRFSGMHFVKRGRLDWLIRYFM